MKYLQCGPLDVVLGTGFAKSMMQPFSLLLNVKNSAHFLHIAP